MCRLLRQGVQCADCLEGGFSVQIVKTGGSVCRFFTRKIKKVSFSVENW